MPTVEHMNGDERVAELRRKRATQESESFDRVAARYEPIKKYRGAGSNDQSDAQITHRLKRSVTNDIYPLPDVVNPERKEACKYDLALALRTYWPEKFNLPWSNDHLDLIRTLENCVLRGGGLFANAQPRGSGKTTIAECTGEWAELYGHRRYLVLICATSMAAKEMLRSIHTDIETNDLLLEDFPEAVYPIRHLRGSFFKAKFQHIQGEPTRISMTAEAIILPTIEGSPSSSAIIQCTSITGRIRGMSQTVSSGEKLRPDFIIIDDPQTDKTAKSPMMTEQREKIINGTICGLAGPKKPLAIVMPCTVIMKDDLSERFLNRDKRPQWQGQRTKLLRSMPTNLELWQKYNEVRGIGLRNEDNGEAARQFYGANREAMDEGAEVSWVERFNSPQQLSAIQFAMDLYFDDPITFASEYQNDPLTQSNNDGSQRLTILADNVLKRFSGLRSLTVPRDTLHITTGCDVQGKILYYLTVAWKEDFGGVIVDYGSWPDQTLNYFLAVNPPKPFSEIEEIKNLTLCPQVFHGLEQLRSTAFSRIFIRDEVGGEQIIEKCGIDGNWAQTADAVYGFVKKYETMGLFHVLHGKGIGASSLPMDQWPVKPGEKRGLQPWIQKFPTATNKGKHVTFDANWWKSMVAERLIAPEGSKKALLIAGDYSPRHQLLADHLSSEIPIKTYGRGRNVDEWKQKPATENHWLDCLVMSAVMANFAGLLPHDVVKRDEVTGRVDTAAIQKPQRRIVDMSRK